MQLAEGQLRSQQLPDFDRDVLRARDFGREHGNFFVEEFVVHKLQHLGYDQPLEPVLPGLLAEVGEAGLRARLLHEPARVQRLHRDGTTPCSRDIAALRSRLNAAPLANGPPARIAPAA